MLNGSNEITALIDSGIGGVSVLKQLIAKHKKGNYIYFADNLYMPYGNKTKEWITTRLDFIINMLRTQYNVNKIIIACNTASTCLSKTKHQNVDFMKFDKAKTYFATNLTKKNLKSYNIIADGKLAEEIEKNIFQDKNLHKIIKNQIKIHQLFKYKSLVLACTHYELVNSIFKKYLPHTEVINNSEDIVKTTLNFELDETNVVVLMSKNDYNLRNTIFKLLN